MMTALFFSSLRRSFTVSGLLPVLLLFSPPQSLRAVSIPDAGSILRDQQQSLPQPKELLAPEEKKTEQKTAEVGIQVAVKGFTFSGYEGLATLSELQSIVAGSIGKNLSFGELNALLDNITASFKKKGLYQARAYLPAQDVTMGIIHIAIIQVKSDGRISFQRDKTTRINDRVLNGLAESSVHKDQAINEHDLEHTLLLINDLPGIAAKATLVPGSEPGTSSVEISTSEGALVSGSVWIDNHGNRYTGALRGNTIVSINDPLRQGDQMTLLLTGSSGLKQERIGYSFPIANDGVRGNLAYTGIRYELGEDLSSLQYKGNSNSIVGGLSYPILRSRTDNITTSLSYDYKELIDSKSNIDISDKNLNSVTFSVKGDSRDQLFGGGLTNYSAAVTTGSLHQSIAETSLTGTEGSYTHFNFALSRLQHVSERVAINISGTAQAAVGNMDSNEKMSLGGLTGVRAYPVGEAPGDDGELMSTDIFYTLPMPLQWGTFQINGFYDAGHITLNNVRYAGDVSSVTGRNDYWLQGVGVGLNYQYSPSLSFRASWAHIIGDNPGRSTAGNNSDGENSNNRFWLQGSFSF